MTGTEYIETLINLGYALLAGSLIGLERTYHGRPAGFRTHALVCTASSLLMLVTVYQTKLLPGIPIETMRIDPTRMAQGIMTGIGFLGAGVIMKEGLSVRGLTTAASIWITASIGILIGLGFYLPAFAATAITLGTLAMFRWIEQIMPSLSYARMIVRFKYKKHLMEEDLKKLIQEYEVSCSYISFSLVEQKKYIQYQMTIRSNTQDNFRRLSEALVELEQVDSFSITPTGD